MNVKPSPMKSQRRNSHVSKTHFHPPPPTHAGTGVVAAVTGDKSLRIKFSDGSAREVPYTWLRDNCRCHACSGTLASGNLHSEVYPEIIQSNEFGVVVDWSDGHISKYSGLWLHDHTLMSPPRTLNRILHAV